MSRCILSQTRYIAIQRQANSITTHPSRHGARIHQGRCIPAVLPLTVMLQLGIIVAVGVLMDTLIIRTLLDPALSLDLGRKMWWPSKLASAVPAGIVPMEPEREVAEARS